MVVCAPLFRPCDGQQRPALLPDDKPAGRFSGCSYRKNTSKTKCAQGRCFSSVFFTVVLSKRAASREGKIYRRVCVSAVDRSQSSRHPQYAVRQLKLETKRAQLISKRHSGVLPQVYIARENGPTTSNVTTHTQKHRFEPFFLPQNDRRFSKCGTPLTQHASAFLAYDKSVSGKPSVTLGCFRERVW